MKYAEQMVYGELNIHSNEILFAGSPVYGYLDGQIEDIMEEKGAPIDFGREGNANWYSYPGMEFQFDVYKGSYNVILDTIECTYNGQLLNEYRDKLIEILGNPSNEGWINYWDRYKGNSDMSYRYMGTSNVYYMEYKNFVENIDIEFYFKSPNERAYVLFIG